jgi:hypothetical protein
MGVTKVLCSAAWLVAWVFELLADQFDGVKQTECLAGRILAEGTLTVIS